MISNFLIILILLFSVSSCTINDAFNENNSNGITKYVMTNTLSVPIKNGMTTIVTSDYDTVYIGNESLDIELSKFKNINLNFIDDDYDGFKYKNNGILMFEDVIKGDDDYNDLVLSCKFEVLSRFPYVINGVRIKFKFYPIALGNTIPLKFGVEVVYDNGNEERIIYNNARVEAFNNIKGFINTCPSMDKITNLRSKSIYIDHTVKNAFKPIYIRFFIITDYNVKQYIANTTQNISRENGRPYGLYIPEVNKFKYPIEGVSIFKAYPKFDSWLKGEVDNPFIKPNYDLLYDK